MEDPRAKDDPEVMMEGMNELLSWAPQTLRLELVRVTGVLVPWPAIGRLLAVITILSTDDFFQRVKRFIRLCNVLSGDTFDPEVWDAADAEECAWGVLEATMLTQTPADGYDEEIRYYIGEVCREEGLVQPPAVLASLAKFNDDRGGLDQFNDDPGLYEIVNHIQQEKGGEIKKAVDERLQDLMEQLQSLPLLNGSLDDMLKPFRN